MSKKSNSFYFDNFKRGASYSVEAANMLNDILKKFNPKTLQDKINDMHSIEHNADGNKHELISELTVAFITPLEREDMIRLSEYIDDVTDSIEDILIHIYINNISKIRDDVHEFTEVLIKCCELLETLLDEFKNFKKSKKLNDIIIDINHFEEVGDDLYIKAMRNLHTSNTDILDIVVWREIYTLFEQIYDNCEHVADVVESVVIENT